jgi:uncharacterized protein
MLRQCRLFFYSLCLQVVLLPALFAADDRGLIYRATAGAGSVHLLGSVHMATADFYPLRGSISAAFEQSDALVVEVNINAVDPRRMSAWIAAHGVYPDGETLRDHVKPETWRRLQEYLQRRHIDAALIAQQKPGLVVAALTAAQIDAIGFSAALGIDQHFLDRAKQLNKPIIELENLEQQLTMLSELPNADLLINQTIDEATELPAMLDQLSAAWKNGDAQQLENFLLKDDLRKHPEYRPLFEQLYTARNRAMTAQIRQLLQAGKQYFVVVGAAHLVGRDGIVELLKAGGARVEQL